MLNKVKTWLGIEGVKLDVELAEHTPIEAGKGVLKGRIRFTSLQAQTIQEIHFVLKEKYSRGRGEKKRIDEYVLGELFLEKTLQIPAKEAYFFRFELPFESTQSNVDSLGNKNILGKGLAHLLRFAEGVQSEYRLEVEAKVKGVALNPFATIDVQLG